LRPRDGLGFGKLGVLNGFEIFVDLSENGGDGGVGVSDKPEDDVLLGGVSKVGEEAVVVVGDNSDLG
jgi:hypothetical protein